ncbi:MAG: hypothetical protein WBB74_05400 [Gaiellaceae bacterium]
MTEDELSFDQICATMKKGAAALRDADVPFMLGGGLAVWARGGVESDHDLDFMVAPEDAERALQALVDTGMKPERPPEDWLYKAWDGEVLVDVIFKPAGGPIGRKEFGRADEIELLAISMPVMALEDVLVNKLLALREHELDYDALLTLARPVREQVNWDDVRLRTWHSPYAKAFFTLLEELEIL